MFTGIIEELGTVAALDGSRLSVSCRTVISDSGPGASMSVSGVCLTVVERSDNSLGFDISPETLRRSALGGLGTGDPVNLERPVTLATRLGGHMVQGHVDAVGIVRGVDPAGDGVEMTVEAPVAVGRYLVDKGSVAVDGVSLTVAGVEEGAFRVALIPHTLRATTLGRRRPGDELNLEVDVTAKYVERLLGREP